MIVSEYVRGIKSNYTRIRELALPDERKYQYCIMKRGGISGLLPFEIRYIDSDAYMYYDITSRQNLSTLYSKKPLDRSFILSFFSSMKKIRNETVRFLLDPANLIWNPGNIYQDLKTGNFGFLYVPYLNEDNGLAEMMDFIVSHVDFSDDELVRCVYSVAEQFKSGGDAYICEKIYSDVETLRSLGTSDHKAGENAGPDETGHKQIIEESDTGFKENSISSFGRTEKTVVASEREQDMQDMYSSAEKIGKGFRSIRDDPVRPAAPAVRTERRSRPVSESRSGGIISFFSKMRDRDRLLREEYDMSGETGTGVAEEVMYSDREEPEETVGTVYVDISADDKTRRLKSRDGRVLYVIDGETCVIGKKDDEVDLVLDETGISRMHARIFKKDEEFYVEDLNSTNGTFKNGVRLKPYEQKKLAVGDEIKLATEKLYFT